MRIETKLAHVGSKKENRTGAINYPIYLATAYEHVGGESTGFDYTRTSNPTRKILEESIAELEKGHAGFACSSGMAAIQVVMGLFSQGDHFVVSLDLYGGTYRIFEQQLRQFGLSFSYVDLRDLEAVKKAIQSNTKALIIETPTNPLIRVTDLPAVCEIAHKHGILAIVDNTFMTPYLLQPISHGADIVVHSATKYLGGHNDVLAGLIVAANEELSEKICFIHNTCGPTLSPFDSWLLLRGMKTLALRMDKHQQNAKILADYLSEHPSVDEVFYPSLDESSKSLLTLQANGFGGMLSFRLKDANNIFPLLKALKVITFAESLGGVESLITYPSTQTHADIPEEVRKQVGVCDRLLRLSVGIEHAEDLIEDLENAFANISE